MTNPIAGLIPDGGIFGGAFTTWWQHLFVGLWFLLIVGAIAALALAMAKLKSATTNNVPGQAEEHKAHALWAGGALVGLIGLGVLVTAIFTAAGG